MLAVISPWRNYPGELPGDDTPDEEYLLKVLWNERVFHIISRWDKTRKQWIPDRPFPAGCFVLAWMPIAPCPGKTGQPFRKE